MGRSSSFELRLLIVGTLILALVLAILETHHYRAEKKVRIEQSRQRLEMLADSMTTSIRNMMITGNAMIVPDWAKGIKKTRGVSIIQVLRKDGREAFSDSSTVEKVNGYLDEEMFPVRSSAYFEKSDDFEGFNLYRVDREKLAEAVGTGKRKFFFEEINGQRNLTLMSPVSKSDACDVCHGYDSSNVRGVIRISIPTAAMEAELKSDITEDILFAVTGAFGVIILFSFYASRLLKRARETEEVIGFIRAGTSSVTGEEFFRALVKCLAAALHADIGFVSEFLDKEGRRTKILSLWDRSGFREGFEYDLKGTPCENIAERKDACLYSSGVADLFPEDPWLRENGIESYLAIQLIDAHGNRLGHMGVMHRKPMSGKKAYINVLKIFADRAAAEITRAIVAAKLERSNRSLNEAQQISDIGSWEYNLKTGRRTWSNNLYRLYGYDFGIKPSFEKFIERVHPADRDRVISFFETAEKKPGKYEIEYRIVRTDGEERLFLNRFHVEEDEEGRPVSVRGINADITERKTLERQLARKAAAVEQAGESIVITDVGGNIIYVNPQFEKITGYTKEEAIGKNPRILKSGKHDERFYKDLWDTITAGKVWKGVCVNKRKDGTLYDEEAVISPVFNEAGKIINYVSAKRDVTDRVRAEKEIERKNREIQAMAGYEATLGKITSLFTATFDREKALNGMLSIMAERMYFPCLAFYLHDESGGKLVISAERGAPESLKKEFEVGEGIVGQAVSSGKQVLLEDENKFRTVISAGLLALKPVALLIQPVQYRDKVLGALVIVSTTRIEARDKSFMKRLATQIGVALLSLEQYAALEKFSEQLKQRGEEIIRKNIEIEKASRLKSEFLANMSHELRTPLNAIIGFSTLLKDGVMGELDAGQKDLVTDIFTSGHHLLALISDILDISKIEAGKLTLLLEAVEVGALMEQSLLMVKQKAFSHNIKLELEVEEGVGSIYVDPTKTRQILFNLLSNAVKFTPDGGAVSLKGRKVRFEGKDFLEISVADTGIGIAGKDIDKLFKPFQQLESPLTKKYEGTGLGLALVKKLVALHGGTTSVESEKGKGSIFTFTMPYREKPEEKPVAALKEVEIHRTKAMPFVLVVEDNPKDSELLKRYLITAGYDVTQAFDGKEALDLMAAKKPDLITLDITMPEMGGFEFLGEKAKNPEFADIPVVIVTSASDRKKGLDLGADAFVSKPVRKKALFSIIRSLNVAGTKEGKSKILVIDDDPKAVQIVSSYCESADFAVSKAYGGKEGLEAAIREIPDLIVLDLMMPDMNGFEILIRLKDNEATKNIPIIIMTAGLLTKKQREQLMSQVELVAEKGRFNKDEFVQQVKSLLAKRTA